MLVTAAHMTTPTAIAAMVQNHPYQPGPAAHLAMRRAA